MATTSTKRRKPSTVRDMVLSLAVVGAAIGLFVFLLPSSSHSKVMPVEYLPAAAALAQESTLPILVPNPLPAGWQANYVRVDPSPDGLHIGLVFEAKAFARLDESQRPDAKYYANSQVPAGRAAAATVAALKTPLPAGFEVRQGGGHVALVKPLAGGGVLTLSDGGTSSGATLDQLVTLARSLKLQPGPTASPR